MSYSYNFNFDFEDFDDILDFFDNSFPFQEFARIMAIALIVAGTVAVTVALACYIMQSIAIHRIAKRRDIAASWLAWIPLARNWTLGAIADEYDRRILGRDRRFRIFALIINSLYIILLFIFIFSIGGMFVSLFSMGRWDGDYTRSVLSSWLSGVSAFASYAGYLYMLTVCLHSILYFKVYESLNPGLALIFTLLSVVVPYFLPISLLCMRNKGYPQAEDIAPVPEAERLGWYEQD